MNNRGQLTVWAITAIFIEMAAWLLVLRPIWSNFLAAVTGDLTPIVRLLANWFPLLMMTLITIRLLGYSSPGAEYVG